MKTFSTMALTSALVASALLLVSNPAAAQSRTIEGDSVSVTVTVEAIEQSTRTLTVKDDKGIYETIQAPAEMKRFSELKVGDKITARYYDCEDDRGAARLGLTPVTNDSVSLR